MTLRECPHWHPSKTPFWIQFQVHSGILNGVYFFFLLFSLNPHTYSFNLWSSHYPSGHLTTLIVPIFFLKVVSSEYGAKQTKFNQVSFFLLTTIYPDIYLLRFGSSHLLNVDFAHGNYLLKNLLRFLGHCINFICHYYSSILHRCPKKKKKKT